MTKHYSHTHSHPPIASAELVRALPNMPGEWNPGLDFSDQGIFTDRWVMRLEAPPNVHLLSLRNQVQLKLLDIENTPAQAEIVTDTEGKSYVAVYGTQQRPINTLHMKKLCEVLLPPSVMQKYYQAQDSGGYDGHIRDNEREFRDSEYLERLYGNFPFTSCAFPHHLLASALDLKAHVLSSRLSDDEIREELGIDMTGKNIVLGKGNAFYIKANTVDGGFFEFSRAQAINEAIIKAADREYAKYNDLGLPYTETEAWIAAVDSDLERLSDEPAGQALLQWFERYYGPEHSFTRNSSDPERYTDALPQLMQAYLMFSQPDNFPKAGLPQGITIRDLRVMMPAIDTLAMSYVDANRLDDTNKQQLWQLPQYFQNFCNYLIQQELKREKTPEKGPAPGLTKRSPGVMEISLQVLHDRSPSFRATNSEDALPHIAVGDWRINDRPAPKEMLPIEAVIDKDGNTSWCGTIDRNRAVEQRSNIPLK